LIDDPARRAAMGRAGLAKAQGFAWPRIADRTIALYRRVLA
jgi:glycosyltransferase involved in cell wall biosynthesis